MPAAPKESFGQLNFAHAQLGDKRRTKRLVSLADRLHRHPGGTLPDKIKSPADLKALYRMCDCKAVTHAAVMDAVRQRTLEQIAETEGVVLIVHDATELDYTAHKSLADQLGQTGDGRGKGYICHNSLAVVPGQRTAIGLTNQILHHRANVPENETQREHRERESRESRLWVQGTEGLPADERLIDVCDRGADTFEFLEHELKSGRSFVIRSTHNRMMLAGHRRARKKWLLHDWLPSQPTLGKRTVRISGRYGRAPRKAVVQVSFAAVRILPPQVHCGEHETTPLPMWVVRAAEIDPPEGEEPVEWILLTNLPVASFQEAVQVLRYYECRSRRRGTSQGAKDRLPNRTDAIYRHWAAGTNDRHSFGRGGGTVEPARCVAAARCETDSGHRVVQHGLRTRPQRLALETNSKGYDDP